MKSIIITFGLLLVAFFSSWGIKANVFVERPSNLDTGQTIPWYMSGSSSPTVSDEWQIDPSIPDNYVPVPGEDELYMIVDTDGTIIGYKHRYLNEEGVWVWEDVNPDIPDNYELVAGSENLYKVTDENGNVSYYLYVRNDDNTYAFVPCDEFGTPYYDGEDADIISENYVHEDGNIYTHYNDNGVKDGYAERTENEDGSYTWKYSDGTNKQSTAQLPETTTESNADSSASGNKIEITANNNENSNKHVNEDGSYTTTNVSTNTVTEDGYNVTYKTTVINTYNKDGELIFTKTEGPEEISRTAVTASQTPDTSLIKGTLDEEYARVSAQVGYNTELANEVLTKLNAEREGQGLAALSMSTDSEAYKLACIRAGDMAIYNTSSSESAMYGTLDDMVSRWGCTTANASENVWKTSNKSADDIHSRLQAYDGSRNVRMSDSYTEVGIAIVNNNGQLYIAEIYLK